MKNRSETTVDRSKEMIAHAINIVRESGLSSLTMKKVAERVGFTETAAYRYFPNKRALLLGLADELGETLLGPVQTIAESNSSPSSRLTLILRHHIEFVLRLDGLPILILSEAAATGDEDLVERFGSIVTEYMKYVTSVLKEMPASNGSARPEELALLVMGIPATLAIRRRIGADHAFEERVQDNLVPFLVSCLSQETDGAEK